MFNDCPKLDEITLIPADTRRERPVRDAALVADPYVAGPYVEGDYDVDLPITATCVAALKPAYRASFESLSRNNRARRRLARRAPPPAAVGQQIGLADRDPAAAGCTPAVIPTSCGVDPAPRGEVGVERAALDIDRADLRAQRPADRRATTPR